MGGAGCIWSIRLNKEEALSQSMLSIRGNRVEVEENEQQKQGRRFL